VNLNMKLITSFVAAFGFYAVTYLISSVLSTDLATTFAFLLAFTVIEDRL
jgi:hypothetical protein